MKRAGGAIFVVLMLLMVVQTSNAETRQKPLGQGITIWFDTGGPVGGPYNILLSRTEPCRPRPISAVMSKSCIRIGVPRKWLRISSRPLRRHPTASF